MQRAGLFPLKPADGKAEIQICPWFVRNQDLTQDKIILKNPNLILDKHALKGVSK